MSRYQKCRLPRKKAGARIRNRKGRRLIASELYKLPNHVVIEGHPDALRFAGQSRCSNWELSVDRARNTRAAMEEAGLLPGRVREVRGYAVHRPPTRRFTGDAMIVQVLLNGSARMADNVDMGIQ